MLRVTGKFDERWGQLSPMKAAARVLPSNMPSASQTGTLWCLTLATESTRIEKALEKVQTVWSSDVNLAEIRYRAAKAR